jgi:hypothetical protein
MLGIGFNARQLRYKRGGGVVSSQPVNVSIPTMSSYDPGVGDVLTSDPGLWLGNPIPAFTYQWQRDTNGNGIFADIVGATSDTYTVVSADLGNELRLVVTGTNVAGSGLGTSTHTSVVIIRDTTPDAFSFTPITNAAASTYYSANAVITGITIPTNISVTNGTYSINGAPFTAEAGTVVAGDTVSVEAVSSGSVTTSTICTLTVGTVSADFIITTADSFTGDVYPDDFTFNAITGQPIETVVASNIITITGLTAPSPLSVSYGEVSVNGAAWVSGSTTVPDGATLQVRHATPASYDTGIASTITIGGNVGVFTSRTVQVPDVTPDYLTVTPVTGATASTVQQSAVLTPTGFDGATTLTRVRGEYQINGGSWSSAAGPVAFPVGATLRLRQTAPVGPGNSDYALVYLQGIIPVVFVVETAQVGGKYPVSVDLTPFTYDIDDVAGTTVAFYTNVWDDAPTSFTFTPDAGYDIDDPAATLVGTLS